jgi:PKD repeat protein
MPLPPAPFPPYINTWFDAGLDDPYNKLLTDVRNYPDDYKIWNLYVQWVPSDYSSSADITISWINSDVSNIEYDSIVLYDFDSAIILADMFTVNSYNFNSQAMIPHHFQIICNSTIPSVNNPPYTPSGPSPSNKSTGVNIATNLNWVGGDPDQNDIVTYNVYFGTTSNPQIVVNNQSSTTCNPGTLNYNTKYYWKIIAWDDKGSWTEGSLWYFTTETQTPPQTNIPPIADANGPYKGYINQTITLDGSKSYDTDGVIEYYRWDFTSNGIWDTEWIEAETITYVYLSAGNYIVSLEVKDDKAATNTDTSIVTILSIKEDMIPPIAEANGPYTGLVNQNITFYATGSYDLDGNITKYIWNFGDGSTSSSKNPIHAYTNNGTYIVTLEVTDNSGLTDRDETTVYIFTTDSDGDGWGDDEENKYGTNPDDPSEYPIDTDNDHIPDSDDIDDDNDGLTDKIEEELGSDSKNKSDVKNISINGIIHFLIDTDSDGIVDLFYNSTSGKTTIIYYMGKNQYLIDENGDGKWEYVYDPAGALSKYIKEETNITSVLPFIIYPLLIIFVLIIIIIILKLVLTKKS